MKRLFILLLLCTSLHAQPWQIDWANGGEVTGTLSFGTGANTADGFGAQQHGGVLTYGPIRSGVGGFTFTSHQAITPSQVFTWLSKTLISQINNTFELVIWADFHLSGTEANPVNDCIIALVDSRANSGTDWLGIIRTTTNHLQLVKNGSVLATTTQAMPSSGLFCIQLYSTWLTGGNTNMLTAAGEVLTDHTILNAAKPNQVTIGYLSFSANASGSITAWNADDIILYESAASGIATIDTSAYVLCAPAYTDISLGHWVNGAGVPSQLFAGTDNRPPGGRSVETSTTNIINSDASGTDKYDVQTASMNDLGIPSTRAIQATWAYARTGEHNSSGTETGKISLLSNPANVSATGLNYGGDLGAHGDDMTAYDFVSGAALKWATTESVYLTMPTIDRTTGTTIELEKTSASANSVDADFMGMGMVIGGTVTPYSDDEIIGGN